MNETLNANVHVVPQLEDSGMYRVFISATHSDYPINNRIYTQEEMSKAVDSMTYPYEKPILLHHDRTVDPVGRIKDAKYLTSKEWNAFSKEKGFEANSFPEGATGGIVVEAEITDSLAIEKIKDKRYHTVSIGFSVEGMKCSLCEADWNGWESGCEHTPGKDYEGKTAYLLVKGMKFDEVSFVNVPADSFAKVVKHEEKTDNAEDEKETPIQETYIDEQIETIITNKEEQTMNEKAAPALDMSNYVSKEEYAQLLDAMKSLLIERLFELKDEIGLEGYTQEDMKNKSEKYMSYDLKTLKVLVEEFKEEADDLRNHMYEDCDGNCEEKPDETKEETPVVEKVENEKEETVEEEQVEDKVEEKTEEIVAEDTKELQPENAPTVISKPETLSRKNLDVRSFLGIK